MISAKSSRTDPYISVAQKDTPFAYLQLILSWKPPNYLSGGMVHMLTLYLPKNGCLVPELIISSSLSRVMRTGNPSLKSKKIILSNILDK